MIRIRDIALPPEADMAALSRAAARLLRIKESEIRRIDLKKRSIDARKKSDVRVIYTVDVLVSGREDKILKQARCDKASIARDEPYAPPTAVHLTVISSFPRLVTMALLPFRYLSVFCSMITRTFFFKCS